MSVAFLIFPCWLMACPSQFRRFTAIPRAKDEKTPLMGSGTASLTDPEIPEPLSTDIVCQTPNDEDTIIGKLLSNKASKMPKDWQDDASTGPAVQVIVSPMKNCFLHFFHWLEGLAIMACIGILTTQLIPLIVVPLKQLGFLQTVLRIYISLFTVIFILIELRVPWVFLKKAYLLQTYFSRGLLYTFLGVIVMEEAYSGRIDDMVHHASSDFHVAWAPLFMQISSWFVFVIGCAYMLLGVCCLQLFRDNLDQKHKQQVEEFRRLHDARAS